MNFKDAHFQEFAALCHLVLVRNWLLLVVEYPKGVVLEE